MAPTSIRQRKHHIRIDNDLLIECIRQWPQLYDKRNLGYKDSKLRENIWTEIAETLKLPVDIAIKKWRNLRDRYIKELKHWQAAKRSGGEAIPPKWPLFVVLDGLLSDTLEETETVTNSSQHSSVGDILESLEITQGEEVSMHLQESCDNACLNESSQCKSERISPETFVTPASMNLARKRKHQDISNDVDAMIKSLSTNLQKSIIQTINDSSDSLLFLVSLTKRLEALPPNKRGLARINIEKALYAVEYELTP